MTKELLYVPILKWKAAELTAIANIYDSHKESLLPLAEIVLPGVSAYSDSKAKIKKSEDAIHSEMVAKLKTKRVLEIPKEFKEVWGDGKILFDITLIHDKENTTDLKRFTLRTIASESKKVGATVVPVVNVADVPVIFSEVSTLLTEGIVSEVCIRVTPASLKDIAALNAKLEQIFSTLHTSRDKIYLLIDLKYIEPTTNQYKGLFDAAQSIEKLESFKGFIFAAGAFPADVSRFRADDNPCSLGRLDWQEWCESVSGKELLRIPTYADYSIRHPHYNDSLQFMESTSTLKYTLPSEWMILKGEKRKFENYLANASELIKLPEFSEATNGKKDEFSFGDKYIVDKANHFLAYRANPAIKGTGRNQDWIAAGISHHIALVMHQLSNPLD